MLKLGIIGAGFITRFQARAIQQLRTIEITGITSRTRESAEAAAAYIRDLDVGPATVYDSIGEMANHVDAIAIYAPNDARIAIMEEIAAAVQAGAPLKGVICEKPLG